MRLTMTEKDRDYFLEMLVPLFVLTGRTIECGKHGEVKCYVDDGVEYCMECIIDRLINIKAEDLDYY